MESLKKSIQKNAFNSDDMYETMKLKPRKRYSKGLVGSLVIAFSLVFAIVISPLINAPTQIIDDPVKNAVAYLNIDINPSFELTVDEDGVVLTIKALNEDAETFEIEVFIGQEADDVVKRLIELAIEKGFLDPEDIDKSYVTIITTAVDEDDLEENENIDAIGHRIRAAIEASGEIDPKTTVIFVKATLREKMEAEGKEIPFGLYVIRGKIEVEGEWVKVSDIVRNENALENMERAGVMILKRDRDRTNYQDQDNKEDPNHDEDPNQNQNNKPENPGSNRP